LTTKIHGLSDAACDFVALRLSGGQAHDNPHLLPLLDGYLRRSGVDALDIRLLGDKAYTGKKTRSELRKRRIKHVIPEKRNEVAARKKKGSAGGRPPTFDAEIYKWRNTVERGNARLKQWRGIATRYDKYALSFLGGVLLASSIMVIHTTSHN
jgi:transposase